jgi:hypothetical protein
MTTSVGLQLTQEKLSHVLIVALVLGGAGGAGGAADGVGGGGPGQ